MSKIQEKLNSLQPYVIGIRYTEGMGLIDVVFKDGWIVPESKTIKSIVNDENKNHHVFYSENDSIGVDELLDYAETIIKLNIERELKYKLLNEKTIELKKLFTNHSLSELKNMRFVIGGITEDDDNYIPLEVTKTEIDIKSDINTPENVVNDISNDGTSEINVVNNTPPNKIHDSNRVNISKVELPPKNKIEVEVHELPPEMTSGPCNCGPDEYCPKCIDNKGDF
jgi:hypothetical protein